MGFCVGGYESFRQETEQLDSFYSSDKNVKSAEIHTDDHDSSQGHDAEHQGNDMFSKVKHEFDGRQEYQYLYCDHFSAWLLSFFECFCKNSKCLRKRVDRMNFHNECVDLLTGETDIVNMVRSLRMSDFVNRHKLTNYQRYFINKFKKYHLTADDKTKEWLEERQKNDEELFQAGFEEHNYSPEVTQYNGEQLNIDNPIDRRIFFELTGCKIDQEDDFEEDEIEHNDPGIPS